MTTILLLDICLLHSGYVMHTGGQPDGVFSTAKLEYSVDKLVALGCQIRYVNLTIYFLLLRNVFYNWLWSWLTMCFNDLKYLSWFFSYTLCSLWPVFAMSLSMRFSFWYHIYDETPSSSSSSLKVTMVRGHSEKNLLTISKSETDGWENATVFIGNQPEGYKVSKWNTLLALHCRQICSSNLKLFCEARR